MDTKCEYCKGIILGASRVIGGKNYHNKKDCFVCTGCSKPLGDDGWKERNGWPWCTTGTNCYVNGKTIKFSTVSEPNPQNEFYKEQEAKLKSMGPTLGSVSVGTSGGFTIDPRTGKKKPANKPPPSKD